MEQERPDMTNCSLSNIIMDHMDLNREREIKKRLLFVLTCLVSIVKVRISLTLYVRISM